MGARALACIGFTLAACSHQGPCRRPRPGASCVFSAPVAQTTLPLPCCTAGLWLPGPSTSSPTMYVTPRRAHLKNNLAAGTAARSVLYAGGLQCFAWQLLLVPVGPHPTLCVMQCCRAKPGLQANGSCLYKWTRHAAHHLKRKGALRVDGAQQLGSQCVIGSRMWGRRGRVAAASCTV